MANLECDSVESTKYIEFSVFLHKTHMCSVTKLKVKVKVNFPPVLN